MDEVCIHDCDHLYTEEIYPNNECACKIADHGGDWSEHLKKPKIRTTKCRCSSCGITLYIKIFNYGTMKCETRYEDDIYELLYTRNGRRQLLREALDARGLPYPSIWVRDHPHTFRDYVF